MNVLRRLHEKKLLCNCHFLVTPIYKADRYSMNQSLTPLDNGTQKKCLLVHDFYTMWMMQCITHACELMLVLQPVYTTGRFSRV